MNNRAIVRRIHPRHWSLRVRLVLTMVLMMIVVLASVTILTIEALRATQINQIGGTFANIEQVAQFSLIASLIAVVVAALVGLVVARTIAIPLGVLSIAADRVGQGHFDAPLPEGGGEELVHLSNSFREMTDCLKESLGEIERQNQYRIQELEMIVEISRQMTMVLDVDELLPKVAASMEHIFGDHQVFIYLVDQNNRLVVRQGTGSIGRQLVDEKYTVEMGLGIIGTVASTRQHILANDVSRDEFYIAKTWLPETQSELAVPLRKGEIIQGVLDIQSRQLNSFTNEDVTLAQSIADQLGTAIDNIRLFQEAHQAAAEAEELARRLTRETWQNISQNVTSNAYTYTQTGSTGPAPNEWLPAMEAAVLQKDMVYSVIEVEGGVQEETATSVAVPLMLRGDVIGVVGLERPADHPWSEDELSTIQAIIEQIALALESARLAQETERAAWRDRMISESTAQVWSSSEIEEVMRTAVAQLGSKLQASEVVIQLGSEAGFLIEK